VSYRRLSSCRTVDADCGCSRVFRSCAYQEIEFANHNSTPHTKLLRLRETPAQYFFNCFTLFQLFYGFVNIAINVCSYLQKNITLLEMAKVCKMSKKNHRTSMSDKHLLHVLQSKLAYCNVSFVNLILCN